MDNQIKYYNKTIKTGNENKNFHGILGIIFSFFMIPFLIFGAIFFCIGIKEVRETSNAKKICDLRVDGIVTEYDESVSTDEDGDERTTYAPVFSYEYNGVSYKHKGRYYSSDHDFSIGQKVDIYINADEPETVYIPEYKARESSSVTFVITGGLMVLVFILGLVYNIFNHFRRRKRIKVNNKM
ncbi:MAG: DUF3592 domain-containing protein [Ruminococcus sp.]|nr:DUF3592 domain-containing protein [Ruminococcus sp.]